MHCVPPDIDTNYAPIEEHGIIGNMKTAALITTDGCMDFLCYPHFDSPSIFAGILDAQKGGYWQIAPGPDEEIRNVKQFYWPDTAILITKFFTKGGILQVVDYMPVHTKSEKRQKLNCILRRVSLRSGFEIPVRMECFPSFDFGRKSHETHLHDPCHTSFITRESPRDKVNGAPASDKNYNNNNEDNLGKSFGENNTKQEQCSVEERKCCSSCQTTQIEEGEHGNYAIQIISNLQLKPEDIVQHPNKQTTGRGIHKDFVVRDGQYYYFILNSSEGNQQGYRRVEVDEQENLYQETVDYWRRWCSNCTYQGRWRETVLRSALTLKILTFEHTGAIVAAITTSLPETLGGIRNWDYRYCWIRDASFTVYALLRIGFTEEAGAFIGFVDKILHKLKPPFGPNGPLQIMYKIDGSPNIPEEVLEHLEGYRGAKPVRIGNAAYSQLQLDIYGELIDSIYIYNRLAAPIPYHMWTHVRDIIDWVCDNWRRKDDGIWEMRAGPQHNVYSKVMCWVALDRGIRIAEARSFPAPNRTRWLQERDVIFEDIMKNGWSEERQAFVQFYGSETLDAANLMIPLVLFLAPNDPRMVSTLDAMQKPTDQGGLLKNSLVFRYDVDKINDGVMVGKEGEEGTFNICSFWLVEALTRQGRHNRSKLTDARYKLEDMFSYANHLGLYSEEISTIGRHLGNFPQAFTHISLISAAYNLNRAFGQK